MFVVYPGVYMFWYIFVVYIHLCLWYVFVVYFVVYMYACGIPWGIYFVVFQYHFFPDLWYSNKSPTATCKDVPFKLCDNYVLLEKTYNCFNSSCSFNFLNSAHSVDIIFQRLNKPKNELFCSRK